MPDVTFVDSITYMKNSFFNHSNLCDFIFFV